MTMYFYRIINNKTIKTKIVNKTTSNTNPYEEIHVFVKQKKNTSAAFTKQDKICAQRVGHSRLLDFSGNFTGTAQNEQHCLRMTCISSFDYDLYQ